MMPEFGPPHSESPSVSVQPHTPSDEMHWGLVPLQRVEFGVVHSVHWPIKSPEVLQAGFGLLQSASDVQPMQLPDAQTGRSMGQSALLKHSTQTFGSGVVSHFGVAAGQSASTWQL